MVKDFDLHPDEDPVRALAAGPDGVLRFGDDVRVYPARAPGRA